MRYSDPTYSFGIVENPVRLLLRLLQEGPPAAALRNFCNLFPCQAKTDSMKSVCLATDLGAMGFDETVVASASREYVPCLLVCDTLEE